MEHLRSGRNYTKFIGTKMYHLNSTQALGSKDYCTKECASNNCQFTLSS